MKNYFLVRFSYNHAAIFGQAILTEEEWKEVQQAVYEDAKYPLEREYGDSYMRWETPECMNSSFNVQKLSEQQYTVLKGMDMDTDFGIDPTIFMEY